MRNLPVCSPAVDEDEDEDDEHHATGNAQDVNGIVLVVQVVSVQYIARFRRFFRFDCKDNRYDFLK